MKKVSIALTTLAVVFMFSCKNEKKKDKHNMKEDSIQTISEDSMKTAKKSKITLTKITGFPKYDDVSLKLEEPSKTELQPGKIKFKFDVENIKLGEQTKDAGENGLANSDKGQHIHFIIDDKPYMAFYEGSFEKELKEGTHVLVAFPARSYHMSVKNKNAFIAKKLTVGQPDNKQYKDLDLSEPTLIYSRPKGTYKGDDTQKVMLDFYLLNTDLSSNGYQVRATINGQKFMLDEWAPYAMEGLPMGENTIELELLDQDGNIAPGDFNRVKRTFTLEK